MGEIQLAMVLETVAPVIWWLNIILEFATSVENASFVIGTQYHIGPRKEVKGQRGKSSNQVKAWMKKFETDKWYMATFLKCVMQKSTKPSQDPSEPWCQFWI